MKENKRIFMRAFLMTGVIIICITMALGGMALAYENTRSIGFGENKKAFETGEGFIRILDYLIEY